MKLEQLNDKTDISVIRNYDGFSTFEFVEVISRKLKKGNIKNRQGIQRNPSKSIKYKGKSYTVYNIKSTKLSTDLFIEIK